MYITLWNSDTSTLTVMLNAYLKNKNFYMCKNPVVFKVSLRVCIFTCF